MGKNIKFLSALLFMIVFLLKAEVVSATTTKTLVAKSITTATCTDNYIQNLATQTFNKLLAQILPKDKLSSLLNFSSHLTYDEDKGGTQSVYLPTLVFPDDGSYFSANSVTTSSLAVSGTSNLNGDLSVTGNSTLGSTNVSDLQVSGKGITIYDRTSSQPMCIYSDNGILQISPGSC